MKRLLCGLLLLFSPPTWAADESASGKMADGTSVADLSGQKVVMGASVFVMPVVQRLYILDLSSREIPVCSGSRARG